MMRHALATLPSSSANYIANVRVKVRNLTAAEYKDTIDRHILPHFIGRRVRIPAILLGTGRHVLAALLVSNLIIFGLRYLVGFRLGQWWWTPILASSIIAAVTLWAWVLDVRKARQAR